MFHVLRVLTSLFIAIRRKRLLVTVLGSFWIASFGPVTQANIIYDNTSISAQMSELIFPDPGNWFAAQPFLLGDYNTVSSVNMSLSQLVSGSTPSGILSIQLWDDSGVGTPGSFVGELGTIDVSTLPPDPFAAELFLFDAGISGLTPNATYHIFIDLSALTLSVGPFGSPFLGALQSSTGTNGSPGLLINTTTFQPPPFVPSDWESQGALFGEPGERYLQMAITAQNVPLPSTLVLFALGLVALRRMRRR